jgi:Putative peptidoglycan binding domain
VTRVMGDTIHDNIHALPPTIQLVGGYDTGSPDIKWIPSDWNAFPHIPHVHIDQGYGDTPVAEAHVMVFDVEAGAFTPEDATRLINANTSPRPTIYVNRDNMYATIRAAKKSLKWKGDVWLAFPGWKPGTDLPSLPAGCRYVAIQNVFAGSYDLSTVLDDSWPAVNWTEELVKELPTIAEGATGPFVRRVQGLCNADGHAIAIDGSFGPATKAAVQNIQTAAHVTSDGIVGQQTWPVLLGV